MEKEQKIFIGLIAITFIIAVVIATYFLVIKKDNSSDALKFKKEYEVYNHKAYENSNKYLNVNLDNNNLYVYKTDEEIVDVLQNKTGVIYFGFADCPFCRSMVSVLNEVGKDNKIDEIYYVDIANIRDTYEIMNKTAVKITNGTSSYYIILDILDDYLSPYTIKDENGIEYNTGVKRLYAPTVVVVKNGEIKGFHEGTIEGALYNEELNSEQKKELIDIYSNMIETLNEEMCTKKSC